MKRRTFVQTGGLLLLAPFVGPRDLLIAEDGAGKPAVRIGLLTDVHYADKDRRNNRYYRESVAKIEEAGECFRSQNVDFIVELGDLIDSLMNPEHDRHQLTTIDSKLAEIHPERHYVLGNHCVESLSKREFLDQVQQAASYYSFDRGNVHFIVLDACFRSDGEPYHRENFRWNDSLIPAEELEWLRTDLASTSLSTVVFVHQRIDVKPPYGIHNAPEVRRILSESGKVRAVFQGHSHRNDVNEIDGVHYCTLQAVIEGTGADNNSYGILDVYTDGRLHLQGYRRQQTRDFI
ncbi:metallophosphoesterase [Planctomicrobium sp. SH664]|uniref:metallophosphoesterase n=1 Tax=Planctomicrobium sp. SH664 TaxID=3448125 RepID=UPI003F5C7663